VKILLGLAALLLASLGAFGVWGREQLAVLDHAHEQLLGREPRLHQIQQQLGAEGSAAFAGLGDERNRLVALAQQRLQLLVGTDAGAAPPTRLLAALAASPCEALRPGGVLHGKLREQAGLPTDDSTPVPDQASGRELALARLVSALGAAGAALSVDVLQLRGDGNPAPVREVPQLQHVEAQLVVSGSLPDVLAALEALAPSEGGGLPAITVREAYVRRIEPSSWGDNLHLLATPPVRLTATVDVLLAASGGS
jgi:hypothetical protein